MPPRLPRARPRSTSSGACGGSGRSGGFATPGHQRQLCTPQACAGRIAPRPLRRRRTARAAAHRHACSGRGRTARQRGMRRERAGERAALPTSCVQGSVQGGVARTIGDHIGQIRRSRARRPAPITGRARRSIGTAPRPRASGTRLPTCGRHENERRISDLPSARVDRRACSGIGERA